MSAAEKKALFVALQIILGNQVTTIHALRPLVVEQGQTKVLELLDNMVKTTGETMEMVAMVVKNLP